MCDLHQSLSSDHDVLPSSTPKRRVRLWEVTDQIHCSVIGTCASVEDLRKLAKKLRIRIAEGAVDYDIHGYFVRESTTDKPFTRAFHKLMDERHRGAVRRVGRTRDADALETLWAEMRDRGQIASGYWAFMTHSHVPSDVRNLIFGEVHMLSHLAGNSYRKKNAETAQLRDQLQEAAERSLRVESGLRASLEDRDAEIERLRAEVTQLKAASVATAEPQRMQKRKVSGRLDKIERALVSARVRARDAEARERDLSDRLRKLEPIRQNPGCDGPGTAVSETEVLAQLSGKVVLYVGGRLSTLDRMRSVAAEYDAQFRHHDGGMEQTPQRLDRLLPSVDCVLCPIDCVSHDACQRAKKACQRLEKPFVPLRSSSLASFRSALEELDTRPFSEKN